MTKDKRLPSTSGKFTVHLLSAANYAGRDGAADLLAGHIKNGSQGVWGPIPMPPNAVTEEEAKTLAEWVLSLK